MGSTPKMPNTDFPPSPPSPFDENILLARKRARKKALASFGVTSATLTMGGMKPKPGNVPTIAGSISDPTRG